MYSDCGHWCDMCFEEMCCVCKLKKCKTVVACIDCQDEVIEYLLWYSQQLTLDDFLVVTE